jgi:hypothetical protein
VASSESRRRTAARFELWNALKRRDRHGRMKRRAFGATPLGAEVLGELIGPLADFSPASSMTNPFRRRMNLTGGLVSCPAIRFRRLLWRSWRRSSTI